MMDKYNAISFSPYFLFDNEQGDERVPVALH